MAYKLLITGASGYVGAMLIREFVGRSDVDAIFGIDKELASELYAGNKKVTFVQANLGDTEWIAQARAFAPDIIIHTAWQIREMYGQKELQWKWNITGSDNVFDLAFSTPSVKKLIHFSTVASYGAFSTNSVDHFFTENEAFRKTNYLYAEEKRITEEHLSEKYKNARNKPQVFVVRPAAITGPRGRYARIRFGLQSALSGMLKTQKSFFYNIISLWVSWVPVTPKWLRQYIHEDDVTDIISLLSFNNLEGKYEAFNISPPGDVVLGDDMAKAVGKRKLPIYPWMVRLAFFWVWHITHGKIPTSRGSWKGYSYPIAVDGSKITKMYGYKYKYPSKEAFVKKEGRYMEFVE